MRLKLLLLSRVLPHCSFQTVLDVWEELRRIEAIPGDQRTRFERIFIRNARKRWYETCQRYGGGIDHHVIVGRGVVFAHYFNGVHITAGAKIGDRCHIMQGVTIGLNVDRNGVPKAAEVPTIGNDVLLGAYAQIIGRCVIGDGARIGAGVVLVNATVPPGAVIVNRSAYDLTNQRDVYPHK